VTLGSVGGKLLGVFPLVRMVLDQLTKTFDRLSIKLRFLHLVLHVHSTKWAESESVHYCSMSAPERACALTLALPTSVQADAALVHGIGKGWRDSWEFHWTIWHRNLSRGL
jgi:hypothetical protein